MRISQYKNTKFGQTQVETQRCHITEFVRTYKGKSPVFFPAFVIKQESFLLLENENEYFLSPESILSVRPGMHRIISRTPRTSMRVLDQVLQAIFLSDTNTVPKRKPAEEGNIQIQPCYESSFFLCFRRKGPIRQWKTRYRQFLQCYRII